MSHGNQTSQGLLHTPLSTCVVLFNLLKFERSVVGEPGGLATYARLYTGMYVASRTWHRRQSPTLFALGAATSFCSVAANTRSKKARCTI